MSIARHWRLLRVFFLLNAGCRKILWKKDDHVVSGFRVNWGLQLLSWLRTKRFTGFKIVMNGILETFNGVSFWGQRIELLPHRQIFYLKSYDARAERSGRFMLPSSAIKVKQLVEINYSIPYCEWKPSLHFLLLSSLAPLSALFWSHYWNEIFLYSPFHRYHKLSRCRCAINFKPVLQNFNLDHIDLLRLMIL